MTNRRRLSAVERYSIRSGRAAAISAGRYPSDVDYSIHNQAAPVTLPRLRFLDSPVVDAILAGRWPEAGAA